MWPYHLVENRPLLFAIDMMICLSKKYNIKYHPMDVNYSPHVLSPFVHELKTAIETLLTGRDQTFKTMCKNFLITIPEEKRNVVYKQVLQVPLTLSLRIPEDVELFFVALIYTARLAVEFCKAGFDKATHFFVKIARDALTTYNKMHGSGMYLNLTEIASEYVLDPEKLSVRFLNLTRIIGIQFHI